MILKPSNENKPVMRAVARQCPVAMSVLAILGIVYGVELMLSAGAGAHGFLAPSLDVLMKMGALNGGLVLHAHQVERMVTAPWLHVGVWHVMFNGLALYWGGFVLERLLGGARFFLIYAVSALGGSVLSIVTNGMTGIGVGASGAIMGLFAAMIVLSFRFPKGNLRRSLQDNALRVLIPSLLPLMDLAGLNVDYGAHLGGAVGGAAVAAFWLWTTRGQEGFARRKTGTLWTAWIAGGVFAVGAAMRVLSWIS